MNENRKHNLVQFLIAATTLPFLFLVSRPDSLVPSSSTAPMLAQYLSSVIGYIGVSLLVWQLILGTRSISGLFFDDLPSKLHLHKNLGKYGIAFVFLHPLLIMYTYGENLLYVVIPNRSSAFESAVTWGRFAFFGLLIVWLTSAVLKSKIAYRPWKYIHYISYPTLFFSLLHVPEIGSSFADKFIQFYWYSFIVVAILSFALRLRHIFGFGKVRYEVMENTALNKQVQLLRLRYKDKNLGIRTGQYAYVQSSLFGEEHPFTILDHNREQGEILIAFKKFGKFTKKLATLPVGDIVLIDGPYGVFTAERALSPTRAAVFIAGGIGVTPFVRHVLNGDPSQQLMFYGNQRKDLALFRDILRQKLGANFVDIFSDTSTQPQTTEQNVEYGFLSAEVLAKYIEQPKDYDYFICGPKGMMDAAKTILAKSLGVPSSQIHTEDFSF